MPSKPILKLLIFLIVVLMTADMLTTNSLFFNFLSYISFLFLSLIIFDYKEISYLAIYVFASILLIFFICGIFGSVEINVLLKYILLASAFSMTFLKSRKLDKGVFQFMLLIPYLVVLTVGFIQLIILITSPDLILPLLDFGSLYLLEDLVQKK